VPARFPPWSDTVLRAAIAGVVAGACALVVGPMIYVRVPWGTRQGEVVLQPVDFDHRHHVKDDDVPCLYCHPDAATGEQAGVPAATVCMGCHDQVFPDSAKLAPVRRAEATGVDLAWQRVNRLPDFVYFDHSIHVTGKQIACATCHGAVEDMPAVVQVRPLTMGWCLDCHRREAPDKTFCSACHR
jgi:hypothetical protein